MDVGISCSQWFGDVEKGYFTTRGLQNSFLPPISARVSRPRALSPNQSYHRAMPQTWATHGASLNGLIGIYYMNNIYYCMLLYGTS